MIRLSSALAVAIATILVCCNAESRQERDVSPDRLNDAAFRQKQEVDNFIRLLVQNELMNGGRHFSRIGGTNGRQRSFVYGLTADKLGDNLDRTAPYGELNGVEDEKMQYARFIDSLGGGNFVRNLDSIGGGNLVRNLDSIGGGNLVRNLDSIGGGNLVRNLDSIGGGNLVRNLDSIGGGNLVRNLDSIGGGNLVKKNLDQIGGPNLVKRHVDSLGGGNLVREVYPMIGNFV
ncbi:uncharacterized protein LOC126966270 isoform X2 [Leptidea sinapis]|uniref:uncharacterized protein LOC126966270 isoform X2 n=1 Tax=Leptidea sinapis TaxID=189913 RepID=UPI0021C39DD4|nr:uncharacterized protein LOC126966270 isoform X2 [Leptidea sinapis]